MVTVISFHYESESLVARSLLDDAGISYVVRNEFTLNADPLYSTAVQGLWIQVRKKDAQVAIEVLRKGGFPVSLNDDHNERLQHYVGVLINGFKRYTDPIPLLNNHTLKWRAIILSFVLFWLLYLVYVGIALLFHQLS